MHHDPRFRLDFRLTHREAQVEVVARAVARSGVWLSHRGEAVVALMGKAADAVRGIHAGTITEAEARAASDEIDAACPAESSPDEWFAADVASLAIDFAIGGEMEDAMYALNSALIGAFDRGGPVPEAEEMLAQVKDLDALAPQAHEPRTSDLIWGSRTKTEVSDG